MAVLRPEQEHDAPKNTEITCELRGCSIMRSQEKVKPKKDDHKVKTSRRKGDNPLKQMKSVGVGIFVIPRGVYNFFNHVSIVVAPRIPIPRRWTTFRQIEHSNSEMHLRTHV